MSELVNSNKRSLLFWVVCGISKYPWINAVFDPVVACDDHSIFCGMNKVVVKHVLPHCLDEFMPAMSHELVSLSLPMRVPTGDPTFK